MVKALPFAIALVSFAVAASPAAAETITFTRDGATYTANVDRLANGDTRIVGRETVSGKRFKLTLRGDTVSGTYEATRVNFAWPSTGAAPTQLSSR